MKKRMSVIFLSFLLVVSLMQCYAAAEKQTRLEENAREVNYDGSSPHVLIPEQYSSYLGGSSNDELTALVFEEPDIVYLAGTTSSTDFADPNGYQDTNAGAADCFIMKMNIATETVIYATYIGGNASDYLADIEVDDDGNLYATGFTVSLDFPTVNAYQPVFGMHTNPTSDFPTVHTCQWNIRHTTAAFVFKLNPTGDELLYSMSFGPTSTNVAGASIDVDSSGNSYVFGDVFGGGIDLVNPIDDVRGIEECILLKFNSTGNGLDYASYIGGSDADYPSSMSIDDDGNVFLIGYTESDDLPGLSGYDTSYNGAKDCFVIKLNSTLNGYEYSTYIGGAGIDETSSATVDSSGSVFVTGSTSSTAFPTVNAYDDEISGLRDCFVFSLMPDGSSLSYSTYLGGSGVDYGEGIVTYLNEAVFVTGHTRSSDFPTTNGADTSFNGETDCFVSKLNLSTNALEYSTYVGGSLDDYGECIAVTSDESMIIAGYTTSEDFPTDTSHKGMNDWFLHEILKPVLSGGFDPTLLLYVGVGVAAVVVIAVVVYVKRR